MVDAPKIRNAPTPITLSRTVTGTTATDAVNISPVNGYYHDIMVIANATGAFSIIVYNGATELGSFSGSTQTVARVISKQGTKPLNLRIEISPVPASWEYKLIVTHGRITGAI